MKIYIQCPFCHNALISELPESADAEKEINKVQASMLIDHIDPRLKNCIKFQDEEG